MSQIDNKDIAQLFADLNKRIARLETAEGRSVVGTTAAADVITNNATIGAGASNIFNVDKTWADSDVGANPNAIPMFSLYVDNDNNSAYEYPNGGSLSAGQKNLRFEWWLNQRYFLTHLNNTRAVVRVVNLDSSSHTYYLRTMWTFIKPGAGVT